MNYTKCHKPFVPLGRNCSITNGTYLMRLDFKSSQTGTLDNSNYGCCDHVDIIVNSGGCIPVHREEEIPEKKTISEAIKVYPNPTAGNFYIEGFNSAESKDANLVISNVTGQIIYSGKLNLKHGAWKYEGELKHSGIYLIRINTDDNVYRSNIISIKD